MTEGRMATRFKEEIRSVVFLSLALLVGVMASANMGEYVKEGMLLAVSTVVPTSLPFMIMSDLYVCWGRPENIGILRSMLTRSLGIGKYGIAPLICGNIGGFPIGAKMCAECYSRGMLTKEEAEWLMPLSNNPSPAFVVGGIGMGIYKSATFGITMLLSIYSATILCGIILGRNGRKTQLTENNVNNSFDFVASVKNAGLSSISIISFISVFSAALGMMKRYVKYAPVTYVVSAFLEVTNAVKIYSSAGDLPREIGMILSAFALGFGGISVGLQSSVFASSSGLKMRKYYLVKLLEGVLCASVFSILYMI